MKKNNSNQEKLVGIAPSGKETSQTSFYNKEDQGFSKYNPIDIEKKWQQRWGKDELYNAKVNVKRKKYYCLTMLPYPSGDLHIGHWYAMTPSDARARYLRMNGYNVMYPIGFDAFGLPAENAAIARNIHPKDWTYANIKRMRAQLKSMGAMWDWNREVTSSNKDYYHWTQWFFLKYFSHDLAYRKKSAVDFCPKCNTTLAREQVVGEERSCERCDTPVTKKELDQWFLRITNYADELLDFSTLDWPEKIKSLQKNWIGRSLGASIKFNCLEGNVLEVFTTRPDTLWGVTFMVISPEHSLVGKLTKNEQKVDVADYVSRASRQTEIERLAVGREKTGVFTGSFAINPANGQQIPIWIADYVLSSYGTGAIMAVPAHDERDFEFAKKYDLEIRQVIKSHDLEISDQEDLSQAIVSTGEMINSGPLSGTSEINAVGKTVSWLEKNNIGHSNVNYRLHDWLISRQRYWGCPIPIIHCDECGIVAVPEEQLPVELPEDIEWRPTGESPLKFHPTWKYTKCPKCNASAERETDTIDTFVCSSWYHLRYLSPSYNSGPFDSKEYKYWMPVDCYTGGAEHATMHLIYTRFFHKANRDMGIQQGNEPMLQLRNQGQILGPDGQRMSKSRGNVVDPDEQVANYGADAVRAYLMFGYRWSEGGPWSPTNIHGVIRWLRRVWELVQRHKTRKEENDEASVSRKIQFSDERSLFKKMHKSIEDVSRHIEKFEFNTVVSTLMQLTNEVLDSEKKIALSTVYDETVHTLLKLMAPITPHITEELWDSLGKKYSIHQQKWPSLDLNAAAAEFITLVIQVNGKVRGKIEVMAGIEEREAELKARQLDNVVKALNKREPSKVVFVANKLINFVI